MCHCIWFGLIPGTTLAQRCSAFTCFMFRCAACCNQALQLMPGLFEVKTVMICISMDNHVLQSVSPSLAGEGSFECANFSPLRDTCVSPTPSTLSTEKVRAYVVRSACPLSGGNTPIDTTHLQCCGVYSACCKLMCRKMQQIGRLTLLTYNTCAHLQYLSSII